MNTQTIIEQSINSLNREKRWVEIYTIAVQNLRDCCRKKDTQRILKFEKRARRAEARATALKDSVLKKLNKLPIDYQKFLELRNMIDNYHKTIHNEVCNPIIGNKGIIPKLLTQKKINWDAVESETARIYAQGVKPLIQSINTLISELEKILEYLRLKQKLGKEVWWGRMTEEEKKQRIHEMSDKTIFYHACKDSSEKSHIINGGPFDERYATNGGFWITENKACAFQAASEYQAVDKNSLKCIKVVMRKKIAKKLIHVKTQSQGMISAGCTFLCIESKFFKDLNNEIKNGTIFYQPA